MKKSKLSYKTRLLRIGALLCLLSSYLWIAPSQAHALSAGFQEYYVLGNEEQTHMTGGATADNQMVYAPTAVSASAPERTQPQTLELSSSEHLWSTDPFQTDGFSLSVSKGDVSQTYSESNPAAPLRNGQTTTLTVDIISSPWATVDSNPNPPDDEIPRVFVVEAVITNTGTISDAEDLRVVLDYNEDPENNWELLPGEIQIRTVDSLAPGEAYYAYWFASYPITPSLSHQYTVTAWADNADPVATSDNYYGNPETGKTVKTRDTLSTGNSGVIQTSAEVVVGVAFTVTVKYDLGTNPDEAIFSPVGNFDFDPSAYRLMATEADLYNIDTLSDLLTVTDHLYLPLPDWPAATDVGADVTYTFIALRPTNTQLCPYTVVQKGTTKPKYDQFFCDPDKGTVIPITGTLTLSMTKQASSPTVQQDQPLTYTIYYTNTGDQPLSYVWIWDDVDTDSASILTASINPASDPDETTDSRVAWYLGDVGSSDQVTGTGTLNFTILIDGDNQYLADHPLLVNHALLGFNPGSLPWNVVLTSTVTTTIQVPVLTITKSDFPDPVLTGRLITYTLHYTNSGSAPATNVLITDVVPLSTTYQTCSPSPCGESSGVVSWTIGTVPSDTNATVNFSVLVSDALETGTLIRNEDYGIIADQTDFIPGPLVTTLVNRDAAFFEGYTFIDADGDGFYDASEGPLPDVTVTLPDAAVPVTTTDDNGYYHFRVETEGPVSVTADLPAGYFRTTPGTVFLESTFWTTQTVDFGYAPTDSGFAAIYGIVFEDTDGDGVQDAGEPGISGVTVTLDGSIATTTDLNGSYTFSTTVAGVHTVIETDPSGYVSTTPNEVHVDVALGNGYQVDFGDALDSSGFATIYGTVFNDADGDGTWDANETGLSGVTVTLDGGTTTTDAYGSYTFSTAVVGIHTVVETDPSGYFSTTPNEVHVDVALGNGYQVDFGDALDSSDFATIYGTVFNDADGDGTWDASETGISGVTVTLDGGTATTTDDYGSYTFSTTVAGVHTVVETDPSGYLSTTPNEVHVDVALGNGYQVDFGDALDSSDFATIYGTVFNDADGDGTWDASETGISGVTVTLDGGTATTTDLNGGYTFPITLTGVYTVVETDPLGYVSTCAIPGDPAVTKVDNNTLSATVSSLGTDLGNNLFGDVLASWVITDIIVVKEANVDTAKVGDTIIYTYWVTNTGNVPLNSIALSDDRLGSITLGSSSLAPGVGTSGTATYQVQESDLPGPLTNTATVTGTPLVGGVVTDTDSESVSLSAVGGIYLPIITRNF